MDETIITAAGEEARDELKVNLDAEREAAALAERARIREIEKVGRTLGLGATLIAQHVEAGTSVEEFRKLALDDAANRSGETEIRSAAAVVTRDETETRRAGIVAALLHRYDPAVFPLKDDLGRDWAGQTLLDLARECLELSGTRTRRLPRHEIAKLALSTSDFPSILADVANKPLRQAYEAYPRTFLPFSRRRRRWTSRTSRRAVGRCAELDEGQRGRASSRTARSPNRRRPTSSPPTGGSFRSPARRSSTTTQRLTRIPAGFGVAAATLESDTVWGIITTNPAMGDGVTMFHANHANLKTGAGSALALAGLGAGMAAMAKQKGLDGVTVLNVQPRYLVVPVALQLTAFQMIAPNLAPAKSADLVPDYIRALTPDRRTRLDAASTTAWVPVRFRPTRSTRSNTPTSRARTASTLRRGRASTSMCVEIKAAPGLRGQGDRLARAPKERGQLTRRLNDEEPSFTWRDADAHRALRGEFGRRCALVGSIFGVARNRCGEAAKTASSRWPEFSIWSARPARALAGRRARCIYWDNTNKRVTKTSTSNKLIGVAARAAADGDATGRVRLNGRSLLMTFAGQVSRMDEACLRVFGREVLYLPEPVGRLSSRAVFSRWRESEETSPGCPTRCCSCGWSICPRVRARRRGGDRERPVQGLRYRGRLGRRRRAQAPQGGLTCGRSSTSQPAGAVATTHFRTIVLKWIARH
jgi:predicted RecA/RadA family phage recombinase